MFLEMHLRFSFMRRFVDFSSAGVVNTGIVLEE